jgi:general secretion pathway protein I
MEAVVALVLVATLGMTVFSWLNNNLNAMSRIRDANEKSEATINVIEFLRTVNPMLRPTGESSFGTYVVTWESVPITPQRDGIGYPAGQSLWAIAIFDTHARISHTDKKPWFDFTIKQVGYQKVRSLMVDG